MAEEITIKKSTYNKILVAIVVLAIAFFFTAGFMLGGGGAAATGRAAGTQTQTTQTQPSEQAPPGRAQVSLDDDPQVGDANAPLTMIEFSDFQCPFCRRFYTQTLTQIEDEYVKTGKVLFVYRDFPLDSIHPAARPAAIAAECADEQGKFWEYHNKLFDEQQILRPDGGTATFSNTELKAWAADIGLNTNQFNSCLDSNKYDSEVDKDFQDGANAGVSGTPTFYIGSPQKGYIQLVGAQPYSVIKAAIDQELAS